MQHLIGYQGWPLPEGFKVIQAEPVSMQILENGGTATVWNCLCYRSMNRESLVIYLEILAESGKFEMKVRQPIHSSNKQFAVSIHQGRTGLWEDRNGFDIDLA